MNLALALDPQSHSTARRNWVAGDHSRSRLRGHQRVRCQTQGRLSDSAFDSVPGENPRGVTHQPSRRPAATYRRQESRPRPATDRATSALCDATTSPAYPHKRDIAISAEPCPGKPVALVFWSQGCVSAVVWSQASDECLGPAVEGCVHSCSGCGRVDSRRQLARVARSGFHSGTSIRGSAVAQSTVEVGHRR